ESLDQVAQALVAGDSQRMLEVVAELESNGRSLQHFARELARYFRNLVVIKIAKKETPLVAASPSEQKKLAETASKFSEEDLTRYLQLALDLFADLQTSLQPRLHLEMGLLRMVHAGRLQPIEEALASIAGSSSGGQGGRAPRPAADPPIGRSSAPQTQSAPQNPPAATADDLRSKLHATFIEAKQMHVADAIE